MPIDFHLSAQHRVVSANAHFYKEPTEPLYLDRTLEYHDFIYIVEGTWLVTENEVDYPLEKDDVLLLPAGHHHYTRLPCSPGTRTMCLHIAPSPADFSGNEGVLSLPVFLRAAGQPGVKRLFEEIVSVFWSAKAFREDRLDALFRLLILELSEIPARPVRPEVNLADTIIALINREPHLFFKVKDVADRCFVSTKTVETVMRQHTGLSFSKFQMSRKLEMVASLLKVEPDLKLAEIASVYGFCDEFHLSNAFKRKYGVSPTQYKKNLLTP